MEDSNPTPEHMQMPPKPSLHTLSCTTATPSKTQLFGVFGLCSTLLIVAALDLSCLALLLQSLSNVSHKDGLSL